MRCLLLLSAAVLHCCAYGMFSQCPNGTPICYGTGAATFKAGCAKMHGGYFANGDLPACVVAGSASQILPCQGKSCTLISDANFTAGCAAMGGFFSGSVSGQIPVCSSPGPVTQFYACPQGQSCNIEPGFADWCSSVGGFVDGYIEGGLPECAVIGIVSVFRPCNGSTTGCSYVSAEFTKACVGLGGSITASVSGVPLCQVVGNVGIIEPCPFGPPGSCAYSSSEFFSSCQNLGGFVVNNGGSYLPQCFFKDV